MEGRAASVRLPEALDAVPAAVGLRGHAGHFVELLDEVALGGIGELVRDIHLGIIGVLQQSLRHFDLLRADVVADGDPQLPLEDPGEVGGRDLDGPRHVLHGDPLKDVGVDVVDRLGRLAGRGAQRSVKSSTSRSRSCLTPDQAVSRSICWT